MQTDRVILYAGGAFAASVVLGRIINRPPPAAAPAAAPAPAAAAASDDEGDPLYGGSAAIRFPESDPGVLEGVYPIPDIYPGEAGSGGLPGGGVIPDINIYLPATPTTTTPTTTTPTTTTPTTGSSSASPQYRATVTRSTHLWNDATRQWRYTLAIGTVLLVRGARYTKGGVSCYPVVGPYPYTSPAGQQIYYVPASNVRLSSL